MAAKPCDGFSPATIDSTTAGGTPLNGMVTPSEPASPAQWLGHVGGQSAQSRGPLFGFGGTQLDSDGAIEVRGDPAAASLQEVPPGQPQPVSEPFIHPTWSKVPGFQQVNNLMDGFDGLLNASMDAFRSAGFDEFESVLCEGIEKMGWVRDMQPKGPTSAAADPVPDAELLQEIDDRGAMFKEASETGKFDLRASKVGQMWSREIQADPRLRAAYAAIGRSYEAQRKYRQEWAAKKFIEAKSERTKLTTSTVSTKSRGIHYPIKVIFTKEGGDLAAARATQNYILTALSKHARGETDAGTPYVYFNSWSRRHEFLYIKKRFDNDFAKTWQTTSYEAAAGAALADAEPAAAASTAEEPPNKKSRLAAGAKAKSGSKGKGKAKAKPTAEEEALKQKAKEESAARRKRLAAKLSKVKSLKIRSDAANSRLTDILSAATTPKWTVWASPSHFQKAQAAKSLLDLFKNSSDVWGAWAVQAGFEAYAKKHFEEDHLEAQLSRTGELEPLIASLEKECDRLLNMHEASGRA